MGGRRHKGQMARITSSQLNLYQTTATRAHYTRTSQRGTAAIVPCQAL